MDFAQSFKVLLQHEGLFSNHAADPGGKTMYGITEAVARANGYQGDMRDLPLELAEQIAKRQYWDAVRADELPPTIRHAVFDGAYHSGPRQSIKWLQRAVGAKDDGIIGPQTLALVRDVNPEKLLRVMLAERLRFLSTLPNWPGFSRGWSRRIADLLEM